MRENSLIRWLSQDAPAPSHDLLVGIGDDAAVLRQLNSSAVVTTDLICDGTHFHAEDATPRQIGRKAMAVNLSDIAAMAAEPVAAFVSLLLPKDTSQQYAIELMSAAKQRASDFGCTLAGGDTNVWSGPLAVNVLIIGKTTSRGPLLRSGAKPGDLLLVTGKLGGSMEGHHFEFTPRITEALLLHERYRLNAGMDLSDGLSLDLRRLCEASGCGAEVDAASLPISNTAKRLTKKVSERTQRALGDGEDFELLLSAPPDEAKRILAQQPLDVPITAIGKCLAQPELWIREGETRMPLPHLGYEHGRSK